MAKQWTISSALQLAADGFIDIGTAIRTTYSQWERLAASIAKTYVLPDTVTLEDCTQELVTAAWRAFLRFDPERSDKVYTYVVWVANKALVRKIHHWRGARSHKCARMPNRHEINETTLGDKVFRVAKTTIIAPDDPALTLEVLALARSEQEKNILAGVLRGEDFERIGFEVFGASNSAKRARDIARLCWNRRNVL